MTKQAIMSAAIAAAVSSALLAGHAVLADTPTTAPTTNPSTQPSTGPATNPTTEPAAAEQRPLAEVMADLQITSTELGDVIGGPERVFDADARKADAEQVLPLARKMKALMIEALGFPMVAGQVDPSQMDALLLLYGDEAVRADLDATAAGDGEEALAAKTTIIEVDYLKSEDEAARLAAIDSLNAVAAENTDSEKVVITYAGLMSLPMTGDAEFARLGEGAQVLEGELAERLKDEMAMIRQARAAESETEVDNAGEAPATQPAAE
ncbi:MAG: hypothetical protein AAGD32_07370 [Planctomycetota bacterium]